jgi:hypothetical protein
MLGKQGSLLPLLALTAGCSLSIPASQVHPSVAAAPATPEDSQEARDQTALRTAASDLKCERVGIVLMFDRRYANSAYLRYMIEGCGQRGLYAETCATYPQCRYLLVSVIPVPDSVPPLTCRSKQDCPYTQACIAGRCGACEKKSDCRDDSDCIEGRCVQFPM